MQPLAALEPTVARAIRYVLTDVDDTLTEEGRLAAATFDAMERLAAGGIKVVPVTGAPAGWCDGMARMWPVAAVIAENGGLYFLPDPLTGGTMRRHWLADAARHDAMARLARLGAEVAADIAGAAIAPCQPFRTTTLALTVADSAAQSRAMALLRAAGTRVTVNSLWVLAWFGDFDKLAMTRRFVREAWGAAIEDLRAQIFYVGDSANDEPMFGFFPQSAGVATISRWAPGMSALPRFVCQGGGGAGFVEVADALLAAR